MNVNVSDSFEGIILLLVNLFQRVISWLDGIIIIGNSTSLLDLNIALTVFSIIFVAVFSVVRSGAVNSMDSVSSSRAARASEERYRRRQEENRQYNEAMYEYRKNHR